MGKYALTMLNIGFTKIMQNSIINLSYKLSTYEHTTSIGC